jgi:hypothetical protein
MFFSHPTAFLILSRKRHRTIASRTARQGGMLDFGAADGIYFQPGGDWRSGIDHQLF